MKVKLMRKHKLNSLALEAAASWASAPSATKLRLALLTAVALFLFVNPMYAADNPWENAVGALETAFTGPIARGLSLIAIVVGGLMFAFGEGGSKKMLSGIIFGIGMVMGAASFMTWLFPSSN